MTLIMAALIPVSVAGQVCVEKINVPKFPGLAWSAQLAGTVDLQLKIGARGQVVDVEGRGSIPYLVEQAKANVKQWTFCGPDSSGGAYVRFRYEYRLEGAPVYSAPTAKVEIDLAEATVVIKLPPPLAQP